MKMFGAFFCHLCRTTVPCPFFQCYYTDDQPPYITSVDLIYGCLVHFFATCAVLLCLVPRGQCYHTDDRPPYMASVDFLATNLTTHACSISPRWSFLLSFSGLQNQGRCTICGGPGISDAYYCRERTQQEKDRDGCPKIVNLGSSKTVSGSSCFGVFVAHVTREIVVMSRYVDRV